MSPLFGPILVSISIGPVSNAHVLKRAHLDAEIVAENSRITTFLYFALICMEKTMRENFPYLYVMYIIFN